MPGYLDRVLHRLCSAVQQKRSLGVISRRDPIKPLRQLDIGFVGRDGEAHVGKLLQLTLNRLYNRGVAVTGVDHPDATAEVDESVTIGISYDCAFGMDYSDGRDCRDSSRDSLRTSREQSSALGAGNLGRQMNYA
jgi:hypothetical protein